MDAGEHGTPPGAVGRGGVSLRFRIECDLGSPPTAGSRVSDPMLARASLASPAVFAVAFGAACWAGRSGFEAATFALALVGAFAGLSALFGLRARDRRDEQAAREPAEPAELRRRSPADAVERMPELRVSFLDGDEGVQRVRIVRRRPRPLDVEQTVAFEQALALRTLPSAKAPVAGSLEIYRRPSDRDREAFREKVAAYTESMREALERYEAYRQERASLVGGRFRLENQGRRSAHGVKVRAYFPDPFEAVGRPLERPGLPPRPTFHGRRAGLAALLGGDPRRAGAPETPVQERAVVAARGGGAVSRPSYRAGSALVEVRVEELRPSVPADMDEGAGWVLRLPRPGEYRIAWEACCEELAEPARGELELEVVELVDDTPIRSIKELLAEEAPDDRTALAADATASPASRRFESG
jgi:hypothetical protein